MPTTAHPSEIISNALNAIDAFNSSCPSGLTWVHYDKDKSGSPHSTHYILHPFLGQFTVHDAEPCCQKYRQKIRDLKNLPNWYWRWRARRAINKKIIYYGLIMKDTELKQLLGVQDIDFKNIYLYTHIVKCDYSKFNFSTIFDT